MNFRKWAAVAVFAASALVAQIPGGGNVNINITTAGGSNLTTAGAVTFVGAPNVLTSDEINFFWDSINYRLGIGTATPTAPLTVTGSALIQGLTVGRGGGALSSNTAVGASALASNTTGVSNVAVGDLAMTTQTVANNGTGVGRYALQVNTGSENTAIGYFAGGQNSTGTSNVYVGSLAGWVSAGNGNTTGTNNTYIGRGAGPATSTQRSGSVAIGAGALVNASNAGVLGTAGMKWSVGGVQAPATTFHVQDTTASTGVTQVLVRAGDGQSSSNLTQWQTADGLTALLTVNSDGLLRWQTDTGIARNAAGLLEVNSGTAGQYRDITYRIAQWRNGTEGTCDATTRGQVVMVQGGAGVADTLRVCRKDAANAYAWTALY